MGAVITIKINKTTLAKMLSVNKFLLSFLSLVAIIEAEHNHASEGKALYALVLNGFRISIGNSSCSV
jgi:hypothetical protein